MTEKNKGYGHITLRKGGVRQRIDYKFAERPDGRFDLTIGNDSKIVDSIEAVVREIGRIGQ